MAKVPKTPKRGPGRPPKANDGSHKVAFKMQKEQGDYLIAVGRQFGWGESLTEVVQSILVAEVIALQKRDFDQRPIPKLLD